MADHVLCIGLGGTGKLTLTYLKHRLAASPISPEVCDVSLVLVDVDRERAGIDGIELQDYDGVSPESEVVPLWKADTRVQDALRRIRDGAFPTAARWLSDGYREALVRLDTGDETLSQGAKMIRPLGRLALFDYARALGGRPALSRIATAIDDIGARRGGGRGRVWIFVIASAAGGTGSAIQFDIAYFTRQHADETFGINNYVMVGLVALPSAFDQDLKDRPDWMERVRINTFATLRELDHFMRSDASSPMIAVDYDPYVVSQVHFGGGKRPFDYCYLVDGTGPLSGRRMIHSVSPAMADFIYQHLHPEVLDSILRTLYHNLARRQGVRFSALGIHSFVYPAELVVQAQASGLTLRLLERDVVGPERSSYRPDFATAVVSGSANKLLAFIEGTDWTSAEKEILVEDGDRGQTLWNAVAEYQGEARDPVEQFVETLRLKVQTSAETGERDYAADCDRIERECRDHKENDPRRWARELDLYGREVVERAWARLLEHADAMLNEGARVRHGSGLRATIVRLRSVSQQLAGLRDKAKSPNDYVGDSGHAHRDYGELEQRIARAAKRMRRAPLQLHDGQAAATVAVVALLLYLLLPPAASWLVSVGWPFQPVADLRNIPAYVAAVIDAIAGGLTFLGLAVYDVRTRRQKAYITVYQQLLHWMASDECFRGIGTAADYLQRRLASLIERLDSAVQVLQGDGVSGELRKTRDYEEVPVSCRTYWTTDPENRLFDKSRVTDERTDALGEMIRWGWKDGTPVLTFRGPGPETSLAVQAGTMIENRLVKAFVATGSSLFADLRQKGVGEILADKSLDAAVYDTSLAGRASLALTLEEGEQPQQVARALVVHRRDPLRGEGREGQIESAFMDFDRHWTTLINVRHDVALQGWLHLDLCKEPYYRSKFFGVRAGFPLHVFPEEQFASYYEGYGRGAELRPRQEPFSSGLVEALVDPHAVRRFFEAHVCGLMASKDLRGPSGLFRGLAAVIDGWETALQQREEDSIAHALVAFSRDARLIQAISEAIDRVGTAGLVARIRDAKPLTGRGDDPLLHEVNVLMARVLTERMVKLGESNPVPPGLRDFA